MLYLGLVEDVLNDLEVFSGELDELENEGELMECIIRDGEFSGIEDALMDSNYYYTKVTSYGESYIEFIDRQNIGDKKTWLRYRFEESKYGVRVEVVVISVSYYGENGVYTNVQNPEISKELEELHKEENVIPNLLE